MKRITTAIIFVALLAMPFGLAVADCGMDHDAKAKDAKAEMTKSEKDHSHMKQTMSNQHAMMMAKFEKMEEHLNKMMQMKDMAKLQQALKDHQTMMAEMKKKMTESHNMHEHAAHTSSTSAKTDSDNK